MLMPSARVVLSAMAVLSLSFRRRCLRLRGVALRSVRRWMRRSWALVSLMLVRRAAQPPVFSLMGVRGCGGLTVVGWVMVSARRARRG